jgi:serine/threonine protein phosphatase PrpC
MNMPRVAYRSHVVTSRGGRTLNQDAAGYVSAGVADHCWFVADGLGGQGGGDIAAQLAAEAVNTAFLRQPGISFDAVQALGAAAHAAVLQRQVDEPDLESMRTTLVVLVASDATVRWAHVGDSRLYHFRHGQLLAQTRDHSVPQALAAAGVIAAREIRTHADRNQLLHALGSTGSVEFEVAGPVSVAPGDVFLLCTDGAWETVHELEMEADLAKSSSPEVWLALLEDRLLARHRDGRDNYTMVALFVTT